MYSAAKPMISQYQHGFVKNRSTVSNLMVYTSLLNSSLDKRCQVDSIYEDFTKAYDKLTHHVAALIPARKLKQSSPKSSCFSTPSGVPQGSHHGPLNFILFVNDLSHHLNSHHLMYADDLKIYRVISSPVDCAALQQEVDTVAN
ncbi:uncharacterized protein LOC129774192 [Toxorhynchites rutilus septentrionalis]|uniref:uncharacterized protein LOC129774192 n=1 Tax=Toxorhynchites rutilus septentrionalis TaxID=329112 RepID=UPI002478995F|nr:uncharacterized protein LOC129774192 [Toxorhynchites rutilus septentrionalis]